MSLTEYLWAESLSFLAVVVGIPLLIALPAFLLARRADKIARTTNRVPRREYIAILSLLVLGIIYTICSRWIVVWAASGGPFSFRLDLGQDRYAVRRLPDGTQFSAWAFPQGLQPSADLSTIEVVGIASQAPRGGRCLLNDRAFRVTIVAPEFDGGASFVRNTIRAPQPAMTPFPQGASPDERYDWMIRMIEQGAKCERSWHTLISPKHDGRLPVWVDIQSAKPMAEVYIPLTVVIGSSPTWLFELLSALVVACFSVAGTTVAQRWSAQKEHVSKHSTKDTGLR